MWNNFLVQPSQGCCSLIHVVHTWRYGWWWWVMLTHNERQSVAHTQFVYTYELCEYYSIFVCKYVNCRQRTIFSTSSSSRQHQLNLTWLLLAFISFCCYSCTHWVVMYDSWIQLQSCFVDTIRLFWIRKPYTHVGMSTNRFNSNDIDFNIYALWSSQYQSGFFSVKIAQQSTSPPEVQCDEQNWPNHAVDQLHTQSSLNYAIMYL